jgi:hypothetical protein
MLKPRVHIFSMLILLIAACFSGFFFMRGTDPFTASAQEILFVYLFLFVTIFSAATILGFFFRMVLWKSGSRFEILRSSRKQAALLGLLAVILLFLQTREILSIWTGVLLILAFALFEFYAFAH